jgi:DnaJ-class molecular chaperone
MEDSVISKKECPYCQGSGIIVVQTTSMFGLMKKEISTTCENCHGRGKVIEMPMCKACEGHGLVGNEREICRSCNGTGRADSFSFVPRAMIKTGLNFERHCDQCKNTEFEIISDIETKKITKSWQNEEELRQVEYIEQVKVRCKSCKQTYYIPLDKEWHQELTDEAIGALEDLGYNVSYLYKARKSPSAS